MCVCVDDDDGIAEGGLFTSLCFFSLQMSDRNMSGSEFSEAATSSALHGQSNSEYPGGGCGVDLY